MKVQVKTTVEPLYGKMPNGLRRWLPVLEGHKTRLIGQYDVPKTGDEEPAVSMKPFVAFPYAAQFHRISYASQDWAESVPEVRMLFYPAGSGYCEVRVYVKGLEDADAILDELGRVQEQRGEVDGEQHIRYYCKAIRVYSLYEVATVLLAGSVTVLTVLLCGLTFVLAVLTYLLWLSSTLSPPPQL